MGTQRNRTGLRLRRLLTALLAVAGLTGALAAPASAGWSNVSTIPGQYGINLMCKTYQTGGYGPVWKLTLIAASNPGKVIGMQVWVMRGSSLVSYVAADGANGSWGSATTYASIPLGDVYYVAAGGGEYYSGQGLGYGRSGPYSIANVAYC